MRRPVVVLSGVLLAVAGGVVAVAFAVQNALSDRVDQEENCCWSSGVTPAWMSEQIGIGIPAAASDRRAGYKTGERYDVGLLVFTLPTKDVDAYLLPLRPKGTEMIPNLYPEQKGYKATAGFSHLGLVEPETLIEGLREGGFCPGDVESPYGKDVQYCVDLFAHAYEPGRTRVYIRSTIESGVTPPPAVPTT
ncbi:MULTISPECIES: hypothetical protein [unclassified Streptomyces]|uniref:hypothetical protein n=1 Tax=unclassified Streptomyces TaxID=2593676 RepID=UPI00093FC4B4|nr:hypothetical protein [Streptomyces sp. TSRI0281]OKI40527.1 hypothetical protein A6A29_39090 [Streptomyces sp. TSRI0281]